MLPAGFVNSAALNVYHDGSEGIQSHYDDAARFERPIVSLRLFSDSRLSFGTQLYGCALHVTRRTWTELEPWRASETCTCILTWEGNQVPLHRFCRGRPEQDQARIL